MIKTNAKTYRKRLKKYSKRAFKRVSRFPNSSGVTLRAEMDDYIQWPAGSAVCQFALATYVKFASILGNSASFVNQAANFYKYKITGLGVNAYYATTSVSGSFGQNGTPSACINPYPTITALGVGQVPCFVDTNLHIKPLQREYNKYWSVSTYFQGTGDGMGTWNQVNDYNNQQGQFSVATPQTVTNSSGSATVVYRVRLILYVTFDGKTI